ncbi:hypothetical protein BT63DRAFT_439193 [Microthyrium microscopicum]|uniref:F-box domain-containing protein n=1 Tax=Microthyrium microscopicum TaxID=703497 RepID=A0A6A6UCR8_9PEZI|nr:hypothetical protein BT63DRAFT_439193 [Microthyrium microscopicum]
MVVLPIKGASSVCLHSPITNKLPFNPADVQPCQLLQLEVAINYTLILITTSVSRSHRVSTTDKPAIVGCTNLLSRNMAPKTSLTSLPNEILDRIFDLIDAEIGLRDDLTWSTYRSLCLTCKLLNDVATRRLIQCWDNHSVRRLLVFYKYLGVYPVLRKYVKSFCLTNWDDLEYNFHPVKEQQGPGKRRRIKERKRLMKSSAQDARVYAKAMLPNLENLEISTNKYSRPFAPWLLLQETARRIMESPDMGKLNLPFWKLRRIRLDFGEPYIHPGFLLKPLFYLPNMREVEISGVFITEKWLQVRLGSGNEGDFEAPFPNATSPVEKLSIKQAIFDKESVEVLLGACTALKSIHLQGAYRPENIFDIHTAGTFRSMVAAAGRHVHSLTSFSFLVRQNASFSSAYARGSVGDYIRALDNVRKLEVDLQMLYGSVTLRNPLNQDARHSNEQQVAIMPSLAETLPPNLEELFIRNLDVESKAADINLTTIDYIDLFINPFLRTCRKKEQFANFRLIVFGVPLSCSDQSRDHRIITEMNNLNVEANVECFFMFASTELCDKALVCQCKTHGKVPFKSALLG